MLGGLQIAPAKSYLPAVCCLAILVSPPNPSALGHAIARVLPPL